MKAIMKFTSWIVISLLLTGRVFASEEEDRTNKYIIRIKCPNRLVPLPVENRPETFLPHHISDHNFDSDRAPKTGREESRPETNITSKRPLPPQFDTRDPLPKRIKLNITYNSKASESPKEPAAEASPQENPIKSFVAYPTKNPLNRPVENASTLPQHALDALPSIRKASSQPTARVETPSQNSHRSTIINFPRFRVATEQEEDQQHDLANHNYHLAFGIEADEDFPRKPSETKEKNKRLGDNIHPSTKRKREGTREQLSGRPIYKKIATLVLSGKYTREELATKLNLKASSLNTHLCATRSLGLITKEDTDYLDDRKFYHKIADAIKEEKTLNEILDTFNIENKQRLNRIVSLLYKKNQLTPEDTLYLKNNKTVIGEKGDTKEKILQFLESVHTGEPTETVINLTSLFNESKHKTLRPIVYSTFREHFRELNEQGKLSQEIMDFYERCKNKHHNINGKPFRDVKTRRAFGTSRQDVSNGSGTVM